MSRSDTGARPVAPFTFALIAGTSVTAIGALGALTFWNVYSRPSSVVRPGVVVADVPVGGVPRQEVRQLVQSRLERYVDTQIDIATPQGIKRLRASELGYQPELAATLAQIEAQGIPLQRDVLLADWTGEAHPQTIQPAFSIDTARLSATVDALAVSIDRPVVDADLRINPDTTIELVPSRPGRRIDHVELVRRLQAAFRNLETSVVLPVEAVPPAISDDDARAAKAAAEQFVAGSLEVHAGGLTWTLSRGDLASWVVFSREDGKLAFGLHPERPRNWLVDRAREVARPPRDARLKLVNGKVAVAQPEQAGLELDRAASFTALRLAGTKPDRRVDLPVKTLAPSVTAAQASSYSFPDVLAEASTVYGGGIPERNHNVELAASRVDGTVVRPGGTFSFNDVVGRTRLKDGYKMAFGILADADGVQTVPSVAGGICQVATTLFHSAFWAGLPIVERHEHPYWIPKYGMPPKGLTGLDTTVDEDSGLDFQFKNTTGAPLLVQATTDGNRIIFRLQGAKTGWDVTASQPALANFVKTDPAFQRQEDPTLEAGRAIQVEEARDGFDALIVRQVIKAGTVIDRLEVKSHYAPSHNVVLVGTRKPAA